MVLKIHPLLSKKNSRWRPPRRGKRQTRLRQGVVTSENDGKGGHPKFESYVVRKVACDRIAEHIHNCHSWDWVDAFASAKTAQFPDFWEDALPQNWDEAGRNGKTLWVNPPYSMSDEVAKK